MQTKDFRLDLKAINDDGTFEGYLSVYGVVDLGNDVVEKGAFTKTIQENKGVVPLCHNHDTDKDMGLLHLEDDEIGLKVRGEMFIDESPLARERHAMAKKYHAAGRPVGLSIGYKAIKSVAEKGIRHLKELKLYEGSMTLWPMLPVAQISAIKSQGGKSDFLEELDEIQTRAMRYMMMDALGCSLYDTLYDLEMSADQKIQASSDSIDQFKAAYLEFLPAMLALMGEMDGMEMASAKQRDAKAGRMLSAMNRTMIEEAIAKLQALLDAADGTSTEEAADPSPAAAETKSEPESDALHSWLPDALADFKSRLAAIQ